MLPVESYAVEGLDYDHRAASTLRAHRNGRGHPSGIRSRSAPVNPPLARVREAVGRRARAMSAVEPTPGAHSALTSWKAGEAWQIVFGARTAFEVCVEVLGALAYLFPRLQSRWFVGIRKQKMGPDGKWELFASSRKAVKHGSMR